MADSPPSGTPQVPIEEADGAYTREDLLRLLDRETAIARATEGRLAVLILELRRVDRLHALLRGPSPAVTMSLVLDRLHKALRPEDRMAAISDEQVCVLLPRLAHPSQAVLAAVKLLRALDRPIAHEGGSAVLRPCVGIATLPEHGHDPAALLMAADVSRHIAAKREEGYHVFQGDDAVETQVYRGLDLDLERAIRANELELHFQPQVDLATRRPLAAEALLRWPLERGGQLPPARIVSIAENTGLIGSLTFWVLNAALRQAAEWNAAGRSLRLAVNVSVACLNDVELPGVVDQTLKTWSVEPAQLTLEIAENVVIADAERSSAVLTRLKGLGVRIAVDDFGTGFSSLGAFRKLPVDELKIDRPFVAGMLKDTGDRAVVRSAIDLAHHFGLLACAEGVETSELREALAAAGCDLAQGHVISPALPPAAFREWWTLHASGA